VQTLSRLNRRIPGKSEPFILDFVNDPEDIYRAFKPYYDAPSLQEASDPAKLETLKHELDQAQVYFWSEVEAFARIFYRAPEHQNAGDHARMQQHLQPAVDRFKAIPEELGIRKLIEDLMIQRMADNDKIVTRYMDDQEFQNSAFPILAKEIFESIQSADEKAMK